MKSFNEYILRVLNEADTDKPEETNKSEKTDKSEEKKSGEKKSKVTFDFSSDSRIKEELQKFKYNEDNKDNEYNGLSYIVNDKNILEDEDEINGLESNLKRNQDKIFKYLKTATGEEKNKLHALVALAELKSNKNVQAYTPEKFKTLGKTVAYRSTIIGIAAQGKDFSTITNDVFENDPDNVIQQLSDLDSYFDYAAACTVVRHKLDKEDESSDVYAQAKEINDKLLDAETRFQGINDVKNGDWKEEFDKDRHSFASSFDEGMKEEKTEMAKPDFEWKDPATGNPPKGFGQNANKILGQGIAKIADLGNKLASKIPSQHTLENDMARAVVFGVKLMATGVSGIGKLVGLVKKSSVFKNITSKTVKKKLDDLKTKYDEAKKKNALPSQIKDDSTDEQKKLSNDLKMTFKSTIYDEVIPMYYKQVKVFLDCANNVNGNFILKQTEEGWNTKETQSGQTNELNNALFLLQKHIETIKKNFESNKYYEEFGDVKMEEVLSVNKSDFTMPSGISNIGAWFDNIKNVSEGLKKIPKLYDKDLLLLPLTINSLTFKQYKEKLNKALSIAQDIGSIPSCENLPLEFNNDDSSSKIKGIIPLKTEEKEEEKEELVLPDKQKEDIKNMNNAVLKMVDVLSDGNNIVKNIDFMSKSSENMENWIKSEEGKEAKEKIIKDLDGVDLSNLISKIYAFNKLDVLSKQESNDKSLQDSVKIEYNNNLLLLLLEQDEQQEQQKEEEQKEDKQNNNETEDDKKEEDVEDKKEKFKEPLIKLKKLIGEVDSLVDGNKKPEEFNSEYKKWKDNCAELYNELEKDENIKKLFDSKLSNVKDVYERMCKVYAIVYNYATTEEPKKEENEENEEKGTEENSEEQT